MAYPANSPEPKGNFNPGEFIDIVLYTSVQYCFDL